MCHYTHIFPVKLVMCVGYVVLDINWVFPLGVDRAVQKVQLQFGHT